MSKNYYIIPIFVPHEGCPHNCVFCNQNKITGHKDEEVTDNIVRETIESYLKTIDKANATVEVSFFGGTFTAIKEEKQHELLKVAKEYKDKGYIDKIRMSTRPDYINDYILSYLTDYTVDIIELGVQSLDDEILVASGRGHTALDVKKASELIRKYKITLGHQIMPGLPKDTKKKDIETVKKSIEMKPDMCRIYPALVIKDTPMETMYLRKEYTPYKLDEAVDISKEIYKMYKDNNIQVIRMGLQPTETITEGKDVVAGPFHPSFRELVESKLFIDEIQEKTKYIGKNIKIEINNKDLSKLYANKKKYYNDFINGGYKIEIIQNNNQNIGELKIYEKRN